MAYRKKSQPSWRRYEKEKTRAHKATPKGGPGREDAVKGRQKIEIKDRKTPVTRPELVKIKRKKINKVISKGGFTDPALDYGREKRMKLYKGKKRVV